MASLLHVLINTSLFQNCKQVGDFSLLILILFVNHYRNRNTFCWPKPFPSSVHTDCIHGSCISLPSFSLQWSSCVPHEKFQWCELCFLSFCSRFVWSFNYRYNINIKRKKQKRKVLHLLGVGANSVTFVLVRGEINIMYYLKITLKIVDDECHAI